MWGVLVCVMIILVVAAYVAVPFVLALPCKSNQADENSDTPPKPKLEKPKPIVGAVEDQTGTPLPAGLAASPRRPREGERPQWMLPAGIASVVIGLFAFCASAAIEGSAGPSASPDGRGIAVLGSLLAGSLNPLFFVGVPLGAYWLYRSAQRAKAGTIVRQDEDNRRLTHCPDCGRHVSRLARVCPHCGRPLTPERPPQG